jgi:uncharacterized protein YjbI with pentapeptide repeats
MSLRESKLIETKLNGADRSRPNLSFVNKDISNDFACYDADYHVNLSNSNLSGIDLTPRDFSYVIIVNPISFRGLRADKNSDFSEATIVDQIFIAQSRKFSK